ncbi:unnamed protein product [Coffea canephora]|uniref:Uncharacterized protein n=1 Tax=Coffea canephora TaxID=49390 RepID=A0A068UDQ0_COFCA|nr:unnamed protein product [Coffea canephora]
MTFQQLLQQTSPPTCKSLDCSDLIPQCTKKHFCLKVIILTRSQWLLVLEYSAINSVFWSLIMNVTLILNIQSRCSLHWNLLCSSFCPACHCLLDASLTSIILLLIVYHCTTFLCYNLITRPLICLI